MKTRLEIWEPFINLLKVELNDRADDIDPDNEEDWYSMTLGWAIAKGFSPKEAHEFALYIRYSTNLC